MTTLVRRVVALSVAAVSLAALAALTRLPLATRDAGPLLRLSWRARGEEMEHCRNATPAELANLPAHMRQSVLCEGARVARYRLRAAVDGRSIRDGTAPGSDVSGTRAMYVLEDFALAAGTHRLEVSLERQGADANDAGSDESRERVRRAIPPRLTIDTTIEAIPGRVVLVTYSSELRRLIVLTAGESYRP